jgi:protein-S-isoprenylcysteine O-methyltransferase Ste14
MTQMNRTRKLKIILPPTYLLILLVCVIVFNYTFPIIQIFPTPWNAFGILPLALGLLITVGSDNQIKKAKTTIKPFEKPTFLVTDGWFSISRNPVYLGFILILVGVSILLGTLSPLIISVYFPIILYMKFIRFEEEMLANTFGEAWKTYNQKVRRWI